MGTDTHIYKLNKMVYDNYILLMLFIILTIVYIFILGYFLWNIVDITKNFYKNKRERKEDTILNNDNENYNMSDPSTDIDSSLFIGTNKRDYIDKVEAASINYNKEKSKWIQKEFGKNIDLDIINDDILYNEHDNYKYEKKINV